MANLNALSNITPLQLNTTIVSNSSMLLENSIDALNTAFPYWLFTSMIVLYLVLLYYLFRQQELYRLDFNQSSMASSFLVVVVSFGAIRTGLSNNIVPLTFFGIIWIINLITQYYIKKRG